MVSSARGKHDLTEDEVEDQTFDGEYQSFNMHRGVIEEDFGSNATSTPYD